MDLLRYAALGIILLVVIVSVFLLLVWVGFRMGRQTADRPLPPVIKQKPYSLVEEDPWHKPMTGEEQPNMPTGADR